MSSKNKGSVFKFILRSTDYGFSPDAIITAPNDGTDIFEMCDIIQEKIDKAKKESLYELTDYDIDEICRENGWHATWLDPLETYDGLLCW